MSDSLILRAEGLEAFEGTLATMLLATGDLTPLMDDIGQYGVSSTIDRFDDGVDPQGIPWLPSVRARTSGGKTLVDKAHLRNSMTYRASRAEAEWGTNIRYARRHNQGFSGVEAVGAHTRRMTQAFRQRLRQPIDVVIPAFTRQARTPKRQFLGLSVADREEIPAIAADYFGAALPGLDR